jgi:hypothetical protein
MTFLVQCRTPDCSTPDALPGAGLSTRITMPNRLSRCGLLLALSVALAAPAAQAQAPQREKIALHPCVITGGKKPAEVAELEAVCANNALRPHMDVVSSSEVRTFLEKEARGSCAKAKNRNKCLGKVASATKATRTLYITLNPFTPKSTRITGLVVDPDGKKIEERPLELPRLASQSPSDVVRFAVAQLLEQLDVAKPPPEDILPKSLTGEPEPEPVATQTPTPTPEPTTTPTPPASPPAVTQKAEPAPRVRTWKSTAGITGMAVGAVGLGVAGFFGNSSNQKAKEFNDAFANGLPPQTELDRLVQLRDQSDSRRRTAFISAGAGAALAIGGAILWLTDRPASSGDAAPTAKAGSTQLLVGPSHVGVHVVLP